VLSDQFVLLMSVFANPPVGVCPSAIHCDVLPLPVRAKHRSCELFGFSFSRYAARKLM
jgi:hypothetical protein